MGSVSSPSGPSISGYDQTMITNEVASTQATYNYALSTFNSSNATYQTQWGKISSDSQAAIAAWQAYQATPNDTTLKAYNDAEAQLNSDLAAYTAAKINYQNAASALMTAATNYVTALARQQMFTDAASSQQIANLITGLSAETCPPNGVPPLGSFPTFPGITQEELNQITPEQQAARNALLAAYNAYRYLEWQIANARTALIHQTVAANDAYISYALAPSDATYNTWSQALTQIWITNQTISSLISQRGQKKQALDSAISTYRTDFGTTDPFIIALQRISAFANGWAQNIVNLKAAADAAFASTKEALKNADLALLGQLEANFPPGVTEAVEQAIVDATAASQAKQNTALSQSLSLGQITLPTLPNPTGTMSISDLMRIIARVQIMMSNLVQNAAISDVLVRALKRQIMLLQVGLYSEQVGAQGTWDATVVNANTQYNVKAEQQNSTGYDHVAAVYNTYVAHIADFQDVIAQVNAEIDAHNQRVHDLVNATNTIGQDIVAAVNAAVSDESDINYLDFQNLDPNVSAGPLLPNFSTVPTPPDIPHFSPGTAPSLNPLPEYISGFKGEGDDMAAYVVPINAALTSLLDYISPLQERFEAYLRAKYPNIDPSLDLTISPYYLRTMVPIFPEGYISPVVLKDFTLSLLLTYMQFSKVASNISSDEFEALLKSLKSLGSGGDITAVFKSEVLQKSSAVPLVSLGLAISNLLANTGDVGRAIVKAMEEEVFVEAVLKPLEKAAILVGLKIAGTSPARLSPDLLSQIEEAGIDLGTVEETETNKALLQGMIESVLGLANSEPMLQQIAIDALKSLGPSSGISDKDLQQLIALLVAILKTLYMLLASLLGIAGGMSASDLISSGGSTAQLSLTFQQMGIPEEKATQLASVFGGRSPAILKILGQLGVTPEAATAFLALSAASVGGISLSSGVPGGGAFLYSLYAKLQQAGIQITSSIRQEDFMSTLLAQTTKNADTTLAAQLRDEIALIGQKTLVQPTAADVQKLFTEVQGALTQGVTPEAPPPAAISPSDILKQFQGAFQKLPPAVQSSLMQTAATQFPGVPGVSNEAKAGLLLAVRLGVVKPEEAAFLIDQTAQALTGAEGKMTTLGTEIAQRLFRPTEEELRVRQEYLKAAVIKDEKNRSMYRSATLPPDLRTQMKDAFDKLSKDMGDEAAAKQVFETFFKSVERLSNFNSVVVKFILDPAKIILRQFSLISRTAQDKSQQFPMMLGG